MADVDMSSAPAQRSSKSFYFQTLVSWEEEYVQGKKNEWEKRQGQWTDERFLDLRYGMNKGRPTTVIPKTARPSNKKGVKTYVHPIDGFRFFLC